MLSLRWPGGRPELNLPSLELDMTQRVHWSILTPALTWVVLAVPGCRARVQAAPAPAPAPAARMPSARDHTVADARFMQGMIGHHSQAVVMCGMAPTHGASPQVRLFCDKIVRSQRDEIELMQNWLRSRGERVPAADDPHAAMDMAMDPNMDMGGHEMLMPGMLSAAQLAQLDSARGRDWDRLLLGFMIRHHEGALTMVQKLFDTPGSGQGPEIFGYATGVDADQRAEIGRMRQMLTALGA